MQKAEIYFHVGIPKTASTFLQRNVMPYFRGVQFVKKRHHKYHKEIVANSDSEKILFTCEFDHALENELNTFAKNYGKCNIIIVFRRQDAWIASRYRYHIRKNGHLSFDEFFNLDKNDGYWHIEDLEFYRKIELIEKYFPHNKPLVLFQDNLKNDAWGFIDKLADYIGVTYNKDDIKMQVVKKAYQDKHLMIVRWFNRAFRYNPDRFKSKLMRKLHKRSRELFLHSAAAIGYLLPGSFFKNKTLIPPNRLSQIRKYFDDDWNRCKTYANEPHKDS